MEIKTATMMQLGVECPECGAREFPTGQYTKCLFCGFIYRVPLYYRPKEER